LKVPRIDEPLRTLLSVHRRPHSSRQLLEGAIDAVEVGGGEVIIHSMVFSVRGVCFITMSRRGHSVSPVSGGLTIWTKFAINNTDYNDQGALDAPTTG
jgi:hypothetical protein